MQTKLLLLAMFLSFINSAFSQNAIADLKFEEAETAFNNADYKTTLTKLQEYDKTRGAKEGEIIPKSLYLRIVSQNKLFNASKLYEEEAQFTLLMSLRKNASGYLKAMESEEVDDKYREIYNINEKLKKYPADKTVWLREKQHLEEELKAKIEKEKRKEEERKQTILASFEKDMVLVEGGTFFMGNHDGWRYNSKYEKKHEVTLSSYNIGKYEVSQSQWYLIKGSLPPYFASCDNCPVAGVSWNEVQTFITKLNELTGKKYRLPTDAEWEYAARGGNKSRNMYSYKTNKKVMYEMSQQGGVVNGGIPNELGIYSFISNVPEWCSDWYDYYYYSNSPKNNPKGPEKGEKKVVRGRSYLGIGKRNSANIDSITEYERYKNEREQENKHFLLSSYWGFRLASDF